METLDPGVAASRPPLDEAGAAEIVRAVWGIDGLARELSSERDRVFRIDDAEGPRAILKVANGREPEALLALQNEMLSRLAAADIGVSTPKPIPTTTGTQLATVDIAGSPWRARLLGYLSGEAFDEVRPRSPRLERALGRAVAAVDEVLRTISDAPSRAIVWDPRGAADQIGRHLEAVSGDERVLIERVLEARKRVISPVEGELPVGLIHNDAHGDNVRVDPGSPQAEARITGLVDFGDACHTWLIGGLATACAYAGFGRRDPVETFANIARGYAAVRPPGEPEADVLFTLIRLRLALSLTVSAVRTSHEPDNAYLRTSARDARDLLRSLDSIPENLARYRLRSACGLDPVPASVRVEKALEAAAESAGPVLEPDPRTAPAWMIDLSVATGDDGGTFDPADHARFGRFVFDRMRDEGADVGIGRYDEVRWWYTTDEFVAPGNRVDEWRTVHLGIDLFAPPGTPVSAPLPGRVVSVANNGDRLDYGPTVIVEHTLEDDRGPVRFRTLYGHLCERTLADTRVGQEVAAGEVIAWLGAPPVNGDWAPHLHFQIIVDPLDYEGTFPGVAAPAQRDVWLGLSPDPNLLLRIPDETRASRPRSIEELETDRARRLGPSLSLSYRRPLHIVRGRGARLFDVDGQPYLDCVNNVSHVGHAHPRITEVARRQLGRLNTNTRYLHETILEYTEALTSRLPDPLSVCFFVCSGTEANELALRMARTHTRKTGA